MRRAKNITGRPGERGIIITLVAVFMLGVIGAMAALSIDVVTIYTARSEAQLAADAAALAAARVLANSGATSDSTGTILAAAETATTGPAVVVATQVAVQNQVGGAYLTKANITGITFGGTYNNPTVKVTIQVTNLPTFFARIWGTKFVTVGTSATAEAYNPSNTTGGTTSSGPPVAPICVKPWLLPNIDPSTGNTTIFTAANGAVTNPALLGWTSTTNATKLSTVCPNGALPCTGTTPLAWKYYPGDQTSFPAPTAFPTCAPPLTTAYQESIAGCVQTAIACNGPNGQVNLDLTPYPTRNREATEAVNCLTHATNAGGGDTVTVNPPPPPAPAVPFEFVAGNDNPIPGAATNDIMVSDSLVTVPVYDSNGNAPTSPVQIIGFVQLFLNPDGDATKTFGFPLANRYQVPTTVINIAGCGDGLNAANGTPILGNGASPVPVRLITSP